MPSSGKYRSRESYERRGGYRWAWRVCGGLAALGRRGQEWARLGKSGRAWQRVGGRVCVGVRRRAVVMRAHPRAADLPTSSRGLYSLPIAPPHLREEHGGSSHYRDQFEQRGGSAHWASDDCKLAIAAESGARRASTQRMSQGGWVKSGNRLHEPTHKRLEQVGTWRGTAIQSTAPTQGPEQPQSAIRAPAHGRILSIKEQRMEGGRVRPFGLRSAPSSARTCDWRPSAAAGGCAAPGERRWR
eukprot:322624-Pleurochrysis_carterae.AAC.3